MNDTVGVVDLFAGAGGLSEGFASASNGTNNLFKIAISVEKEAWAFQTLRLRSFLREYRQRHNCLPKKYIDLHSGLLKVVDWKAVDPEAWQSATSETFQMELGTRTAATRLDDAIETLSSKYKNNVLIGGPPCQAYSLVGRARSKGNSNYRAHEDERHYLFREYIRALQNLMPAAFVMENVKGILSSTVQSQQIFQQLMNDLSSLGTPQTHQYEIFAIKCDGKNLSLIRAEKPSDFVLRTENLGIAQRRHRVIIVGVRSDLASKVQSAKTKAATHPQTVRAIIGNLPPLRSGISKSTDSDQEWLNHTQNAADYLSKLSSNLITKNLRAALSQLADGACQHFSMGRSSTDLPIGYGVSDNKLLAWLENQELKAIAQHETRRHIKSDLERYLYAACFGSVREFSPKARDFPKELSPNHVNWGSDVFNDRFRVQLANQPATTITSHISKDGHYFIHPDPMQCRSLTVREAARLQAFPDDYLFLGPRTSQYVQVGNAVPPYIAQQIAKLIYEVVH